MLFEFTMTQPFDNSWFTKFNWINDFDLTPYKGFSIDLIAPVGSDFNMTLTQWIPSNNTRGVDSQYRPLSYYLTPTGQPQTLTVPLTDFATNLVGGQFDFANLKDLTIVNFVPVGAQFVFTRITLLGDCSSSSSTAAAASASVTTGTKTSNSKLMHTNDAASMLFAAVLSCLALF
ncbi:hypothetical protein HDU83_006203 [Entophlyctis luteolus]|nr:hypothetical protein HDU83_006203 [Entophlyctis luteolus]